MNQPGRDARQSGVQLFRSRCIDPDGRVLLAGSQCLYMPPLIIEYGTPGLRCILARAFTVFDPLVQDLVRGFTDADVKRDPERLRKCGEPFALRTL